MNTLKLTEAKEHLEQLSQEELIRWVFQFWQACFNELPNSFTASFPNWLNLSYERQKLSFERYQSLSLDELKKLHKELLRSSCYPQDSNLNLFFGASTVPVTPFPEILYSLLLRTPIICRVPQNYSLEFYKFFAAKLPPPLEGSLSFLHWPSQDHQTTANFLQMSDYIIVHGSDQTIDELHSLAKNKHFLGFGHKASLAVCLPTEEAAQALHKDIFAFKQLGCLSPQVVYLLADDSKQSEAFLKSLAQSLKGFNHDFSPSEAILRQSYLEDLYLGDDCRVLEDSLIISEDPEFDYSPGLGLLWVKPLKKLADLPKHLKKIEGRIAGIGHNLSEAEEQLKAYFPTVSLCALGEMQNPSLFWFQKPTHQYHSQG